jgi:hypothetical protein
MPSYRGNRTLINNCSKALFPIHTAVRCCRALTDKKPGGDRRNCSEQGSITQVSGGGTRVSNSISNFTAVKLAVKQSIFNPFKKDSKVV